ncbi:MAG: response regulator [Candidatus Omnitrophica bacterium]|nr:response regulator [Candidatus Omnitrophota bacterium]
MDKTKLLIIDDEPGLVEMLTMRLEANDYQVISASDGREGLDRARNENPDLIILDLMLPEIDGYKVCRMLKTDERYKQIPVIFFTARVQASDIKSGEEAGAQAYISKPFEPDILLAKVAQLLKK